MNLHAPALPAPLTKAQVRETMMLVRGLTENVNSQGGALLSEEVENAIIVRRNLAGVARCNARISYMATDVQTTPRRTADATAAFLVENATLSEGTATFDNVAGVAKKCGILTRISSEVAEDSVPEAANDLIDMLSWSLAWKEDQTAFLGDGGTSSFAGIKGITNVLSGASLVNATSGHNTFSLLDSGDVSLMLAALPSWAHMTAKFYLSPYAFSAWLCRLGAVSGYAPGPLGWGRPSLSFLGYPVELTDQLPGSGTITSKIACVFGSMELAATLFSRKGITIRRLLERYADSDQIGFTAIERFDWVVHNPEALIGLVGG
jgi:HK97 family phage major capsid protein